MERVLTLLLTDLVDSTAINVRLGDEVMARLWQEHDTLVQDLARTHNGREVDRSDGFLMIFERPLDAAIFACEYHRRLAELSVPVRARAGLNLGLVLLRSNDPEAVARGAKPFDVLGLAKAKTARLMTLAQGGQTLASAEIAHALVGSPFTCVSHGHWRLKGLEEPVEICEVGDEMASMAPPPDSEKAFRTVLRHGAWVSLSQVPRRLPSENDSFIGRRPNLRALGGAFEDPNRRIVVLHGPGGVGKTRLALRFAWAWLGRFPGGVYFCDLSPARGLDGILHAVAQALEVPLGANPETQLRHAIAARGTVLLVMDNFEQIASHARATLGDWLDAAPQARFLVTSRETLGLPGEQTLDVAPLPAEEATALFSDRALAGGTPLDPVASGDGVIPRLMSLLDGLPLAIELAAGRLRVMPPAQILQRMSQRFVLLASRSGRADRQATLRASIDASWETLSGSEQSAMAQLSVFEGGFDLQAAESVVSCGPDQPEPILDIIGALVDKSLVRRLGGSRLGMLSAIQDYACERLSADPQAALAAQRRHWLHYGGFDDGAATADRCGNVENLVAACRRAVDAAAANEAARCLIPTWAALRLCGPFSAATRLSEQVDAMPGIELQGALTATWVRSATAFASGQVERARGIAERALPSFSKANLPGSLLGRFYCTLGEIAQFSGNLKGAQEHLAAALAHATGSENPLLRCQILNALGILAAGRSDLEGAGQHYSEALEIARARANLHWEGGVLGNIAVLEHARGDPDAAAQALNAALRLAAASGDRRWEGNALCNLGLMHLECGRTKEAEDCLQRAHQTAGALGHRKLELTARSNLALLYESVGELSKALTEHDTVVHAAEGLGDHHAECEFRVYQISAAIRSGRFEEAAASMQRGLVLVHALDEPLLRARLQVCLAELHAAQGELQAARNACSDARRIFEELKLGAKSELGTHLAAIEAIIRC